MSKGMGKRTAVVVAMAALTLLGGCTGGLNGDSRIEQGPVGIGRSVNELKGTPCACTEIPMAFPGQMKV